MNLRPELTPPVLDEAKVARLAELADRIDESGEPPDVVQASLDEFNRGAGTELPFEEFQGVYGMTSHTAWVRGILARGAARAVPDITYDELLELTTRVCRHEGAEHEIEFWFALLEKNVPDPRLWQLIHQPHAYFGQNPARDLSPREILDTALAAPRARFFFPPPETASS